MSRRVKLKEASEITGLSEWELRTGAKSGRYPHFRVGSSKSGRIIFDIELLEKRITELMLENISNEIDEYGTLRKIK